MDLLKMQMALGDRRDDEAVTIPAGWLRDLLRTVEAQSDYDEIDGDLQLAGEEIAQLKAEVAALEEDLKEAETTIETLERQLDDAERQLDDAEREPA